MSQLAFNPATPLYTSDARAWRLDEFENVMTQLLAADQPVLFFIHGRGKEPGKSLLGGAFGRGRAVHKLERGYGLKLLMLNWDSAYRGLNLFDRDRPLSHTAAGAAALAELLQRWQRWLNAAPQTRRPALLVHSMGSILVQRCVEAGLWPAQPRLFSQLLFSQPDADDRGHAQWLEPLAQLEQVFVTWNQDDGVLRRATDARPPGAHALGLGTQEPLAASARYLDISRMGPLGERDEDHEVFSKTAMNGQRHLCEFFTQALCGATVRLELGVNVESVNRAGVYRLVDCYEPDAPCLAVPDLT